MEPVGIWLMTIGLGDLIAGYSGQVATKTRGWCAWGIGSFATLTLALASGCDWPEALILTSWSMITLGLWLWTRLPTTWSSTRAGATLFGVAGVTMAVVLSAGAWPTLEGGLIQRLLGHLPYPVLEGQDQGRVLTVFGALLFLQASGNALVRLLLAVVGTSIATQESLRGGRFIGPMERTLIFGLGLAGYLTAAAVVATAKGLLRFPEINRSGDDIHTATEYFLVGSLASWILALAPLAIL